jgi:hypothetical protein
MKALAFRSAKFNKPLTDEYVDKAIDGKLNNIPFYEYNLILDNPNINKDHLNKILFNHNSNTSGNLQTNAASALARHEKIDKQTKFEIASKLFNEDYKPANSKDTHPAVSYLRSDGAVNNEILNKAINHSNPLIRSLALRRISAHRQVTPLYNKDDEVDMSKIDYKKMLDDSVNDKSSNVRSVVAAVDPELTNEHIDKLANDKDENVISSLLNGEQYGRGANETGTYPNTRLSKKHLDTIIQNHGDNKELMRRLLKHPNVSKEQISKLQDSSDYGIRLEAIKSDKAGKEHIDKALNDQHENVRAQALRHPKVDPNHLRKAMLDPDPFVRGVAAAHHKIEPDLIEKAINDGNKDVRAGVAQNPNLSHEQLHTLLKDKDRNVRLSATDNLQMTPEHFKVALKDEDSTIRSIADTRQHSLQMKRERFKQDHPEAKHIIKRFE